MVLISYLRLFCNLVNKLYFVDVAWLGSRGFISIAKSDAEAELVIRAEAQHSQYLCAIFSIVDKANRAT